MGDGEVREKSMEAHGRVDGRQQWSSHRRANENSERINSRS